ncbi:GntR family transcriptional regulator [Paenibacillus mesophilus]|uniref:GntR family transcriptional regulator n=1 Tax=Paenibacillus mesophilus TaxID=2582849 RepID=UPI00110F3177|nr:GntR family transcriptional regulator [Paenibacillus mesophilus]TMV46385.1 GntR family transcriptional regulator [Paenibacillus mesophilus]
MERKFLLEKKNISEDLVALIKRKILDGELNPGDRIVEMKLAREFGISQSPVRESIRHLSGEGIITIVPNKGPVVNKLEARDISEVYSLRSSLEGLAIHLTTQHATDVEIRELADFYDNMGAKLNDESVPSLLKDSLFLHQSIIRLSNHSRLIKVYESISFQIELVNRILGMATTKQKEYDDHRELIEALLKRDPVHAEQVMRKHIYRSYTECMEVLHRNETSVKDRLQSMWQNEDFM